MHVRRSGRIDGDQHPEDRERHGERPQVPVDRDEGAEDAAGVGADRRRSASTSAMPPATPTVNTMIGTIRWAARLQAVSPTRAPSRTALPLMWATNSPARVRSPT